LILGELVIRHGYNPFLPDEEVASIASHPPKNQGVALGRLKMGPLVLLAVYDAVAFASIGPTPCWPRCSAILITLDLSAFFAGDGEDLKVGFSGIGAAQLNAGKPANSNNIMLRIMYRDEEYRVFIMLT